MPNLFNRRSTPLAAALVSTALAVHSPALTHAQPPPTSASPPATADPGDPDLRAATTAFRAAERADPADAPARYREAIAALDTALRRAPRHAQAPLAQFYRALALERLGRFDEAAAAYLAIVRDHGNLVAPGPAGPVALQGDARDERINILEASQFRAAIHAQRVFDFDAAIRLFTALAADPRYTAALEHATHAHDALAAVAVMQTDLGRWDAARAAWRAFVPHADAGHERALALYRIAEMPFRAGRMTEAVRALREYRRVTPANQDTAAFHVRAQHALVTALRASGASGAARAELRSLPRLFDTLGLTPGSPEAGLVTEPELDHVEAQLARVRARTLPTSTTRALMDHAHALRRQIDRIDSDAVQLATRRGDERAAAAMLCAADAHRHLGEQFDVAAARLHLAGPSALEQDARHERVLAVQRYVLAALGLWRVASGGLALSRALAAIADETLRPLLDEAVRALPPELAVALRFAYRPGMFDVGTAGAQVPDTAALLPAAHLAGD